MLDNPGTRNTPQFSSGPEPPRQGAKARFFATMKMLAGTGLVIGVLLIVGEKILAPEFKPSYLIGTFGGKIETAEIVAKQPTAVEFARLQAEAVAKAQADAAKKAELIGNTEGVKGIAAQVTDAVCFVGQLFGTANDPDTRSTGQSMKQACGVSDRIRDSMTRDVTGQGAGPASPPPQREAAAQQPPPAAALPRAAPYKIIKVVPQDLSAFRPY